MQLLQLHVSCVAMLFQQRSHVRSAVEGGEKNERDGD